MAQDAAVCAVNECNLAQSELFANLDVCASHVPEADALVQGIVALCEPVLERLLEVPFTCNGTFLWQRRPCPNSCGRRDMLKILAFMSGLALMHAEAIHDTTGATGFVNVSGPSASCTSLLRVTCINACTIPWQGQS